MRGQHGDSEGAGPYRRDQASLVLALAIGAALGVGIAAIWIPERRRRRLPAILGRRYRRVRKASAAALEDFRRAAREASADFRADLGATLEAAREELAELGRRQLQHTRKTLQREHRKPRS